RSRLPPRPILCPYTTLFRSSVSRSITGWRSSVGGSRADMRGGPPSGTVADRDREVAPGGNRVDGGRPGRRVSHARRLRRRRRPKDRKSTRLNSSHVKSSYAV